MIRRYVFKLYPTPDQAAALHEQREMMPDLWNACKQRCEDVYRREHRMLTYFDLCFEIKALRRECPEWAVIPVGTCRRVAKLLTLAYAAFFRRAKAGGEAPGYPRWQRRVKGEMIPLGSMGKTGWKITQRPDNPRSWSLHLHAIGPGMTGSHSIHARNTFPAEVLAWKNADILWRDGRWWLSVCVDIAARRGPGQFRRHPASSVRFNLIDRFADIWPAGRGPGRIEPPTETLIAIEVRERALDALKSERDRRWPRARRRDEGEQREFEAASAKIAHLFAKIARVRRNTLHVWSARVIASIGPAETGSMDMPLPRLTVHVPRVRQRTRSPRGDTNRWGANVEIASEVNRHVLAQAPVMAAAMLKYKAEEAGIRCELVVDEAPEIAVAGDLAEAGRVLRRARRTLRRAAA
jgi:putative transposase